METQHAAANGMDYNRLKEAAEGFVGRGCQEYPEELDSILKEAASTGVTRMQWDLLRPVLQYRLEMVFNSAFSPSELDSEAQELCKQLISQLNSFINPPFTIQRLCELILDPKKHYKKLGHYLSAVEKNLLVVTTKGPDLQWMESSKSTHPIPDKPSQKIAPNDQEHPLSIGLQSSPKPPKSPPGNKDLSPPTAPTSTWPNLRDMLESGTRETLDLPQSRSAMGQENGGGGGKKELQTSSSSDPSQVLVTRKRSSSLSSSSDQEERDNSSLVTVLQEADSTVNFESFLTDGTEESPAKRRRKCPEWREREGEERGERRRIEEEEVKSELKSLLEVKSAPLGSGEDVDTDCLPSDSTEAMDTG